MDDSHGQRDKSVDWDIASVASLAPSVATPPDLESIS